MAKVKLLADDGRPVALDAIPDYRAAVAKEDAWQRRLEEIAGEVRRLESELQGLPAKAAGLKASRDEQLRRQADSLLATDPSAPLPAAAVVPFDLAAEQGTLRRQIAEAEGQRDLIRATLERQRQVVRELAATLTRAAEVAAESGYRKLVTRIKAGAAELVEALRQHDQWHEHVAAAGWGEDLLPRVELGIPLKEAGTNVDNEERCRRVISFLAKSLREKGY